MLQKEALLLVTSFIVVVSSDTMIRTAEQPHARYSPYVQEIAWREFIAPYPMSIKGVFSIG